MQILKFILVLAFALSAAACRGSTATPRAQDESFRQETAHQRDVPQDAAAQDRRTAIFAGGCFWCVESDFEHLPGVLEAISGYAGGHTKTPTYKQVSRGKTGHYEVVKIIYDPAKISYDDLLAFYWTSVDPTDAGGQFCDRGQSYETAIFVTPSQAALAQNSKAALENSGRLKDKIVTPIIPVPTFYPAEAYHQDYYKKNPIRYKYYRTGCGRDKRLGALWGTARGH